MIPVLLVVGCLVLAGWALFVSQTANSVWVEPNKRVVMQHINGDYLVLGHGRNDIPPGFKKIEVVNTNREPINFEDTVLTAGGVRLPSIKGSYSILVGRKTCDKGCIDKEHLTFVDNNLVLQAVVEIADFAAHQDEVQRTHRARLEYVCSRLTQKQILTPKPGEERLRISDLLGDEYDWIYKDDDYARFNHLDNFDVRNHGRMKTWIAQVVELLVNLDLKTQRLGLSIIDHKVDNVVGTEAVQGDIEKLTRVGRLKEAYEDTNLPEDLYLADPSQWGQIHLGIGLKEIGKGFGSGGGLININTTGEKNDES